VPPLSAIDLACLVESTEASAYADLMQAAPSDFGVDVDSSEDGVLLSAPCVDALLFNRMVGLGLRRPATRDAVHKAVERLHATGVRNFGIQLSPTATPADTADWIGAAGLERRDNWTKVYRPATPEPTVPTELRLERAAANLADRFAAVACMGFAMPPALAPWFAASVGRPGWYHYLAWADDEPVAVAAMFVRDHVGWLGVAATLPAHRRRGAQGALMVRRIHDGLALGCRWFVTETGQDRPDKPNPSFHNMRRAGFVVAYDRPNFRLAR